MSAANQPPYTSPAPGPRKSNAWKWILGILGGLALMCGCVFAACTVFVGKSVNDAVEEAEAEESSIAAENRASCSGLTYPDQQPENDRCADASGAVSLDEVRVTASALTRVEVSLCTDVSYSNNSAETVSFNTFDWKLQVPSGEVMDAFDSLYSENSLGSGDLVAGGTKSGTICYEAEGAGQFILIYKPNFWSDARGIWVNSLSE